MGYATGPAALLGAVLTAPPTLQDIEMGRVGGRLGTWNGRGISWQDALPDASGLPPFVLAWTGDTALSDAGTYAGLLRQGYEIRTASCEGNPPLGASGPGLPTLEFSLDARTAFLVAQRCPGSFLTKQRRALQNGQMPLATPQGVLDFLWQLYTRPQDFPGYIPREQFTPPPAYQPDPWGAACDIVAHQDAVSSWQFGRISSAQLLEVARACLDAGGQLDSRLWNGQNIPGWIPGPPPRIVSTGEGTVTLPDGTEIDAPSGGTTELPPSGDPSDGYTCPEGYYLADGKCWAPWDSNGPEYDGSEPPGPDDTPPPPAGPGGAPDTPAGSNLAFWGAAGLGLAFLLGRRRRT